MILRWLKNKMSLLSLATSKVEEEILKSNGNKDNIGTNKIQSIKEGKLSLQLKKGELTEEVKKLRWRTYKILRETDGIGIAISYDQNGVPIINRKPRIDINNKIKVDDFDKYEPLMVVDNSDLTFGISDDIEIDINDSIDFSKLNSNLKAEKPIIIDREYKPKFEIEKYTKKMVVRYIDNTKRLLEFYISKYPDQYDRKTRLFLSEIKKVLNGKKSDFLDIKTVEYITNNTIGVKDLFLYKYEISEFDKIIEFDGYYIIKFISNVVIDGLDLIDKFVDNDLENKYSEKAPK